MLWLHVRSPCTFNEGERVQVNRCAVVNHQPGHGILKVLPHQNSLLAGSFTRGLIQLLAPCAPW